MLRNFFLRLGCVLVLATSMGFAMEPPVTPSSSIAAGIAEVLRSGITSPIQGLVFDESSVPSDSDKPLVVFVPGLLANAHSMDSLRREIKNDRFRIAIFHYSSQRGIRSAAGLLSQSLRAQKKSNPNQEVVLLTHSLGGLVARCCIEDGTINPGNVRRLIMIAPPNHGSAVAGLSATEVAEKFSLSPRDVSMGTRGLDDVIGSFIGSAKQELQVGSAVLRELEAYPRAVGVRYSIIAGDGGPVPAGLAEVSSLIGELFLSEEPQIRAAITSASEFAGLDEWTQGRGDGLVSIESAKLNGVHDFLTLPFGHNDFGVDSGRATGRVIIEIQKRLQD